MRATLNLGHTFGHAIETKAGPRYLHGEAVGIGMHMAAKMSRDLGWISDELFERAVALVARAKVPIVLPLDSPLDVASFESIMAVDKKVADGLLRLILLKGDLGNCVFTGEYDGRSPWGGAEGDAGADFCRPFARDPDGSTGRAHVGRDTQASSAARRRACVSLVVPTSTASSSSGPRPRRLDDLRRR